MISVFVPGHAATQGSLSYKGRSRKGKAIMTCANSRTYAWRNVIRAALLDGNGQPKQRFTGDVLIEAIFILPRPEALKASGSLSAGRRKGSDICKLVRAVNDAISDAKVRGRPVAGALANDVQVCGLRDVYKRLARVGEEPGVHLTIIDDADGWRRYL